MTRAVHDSRGNFTAVGHADLNTGPEAGPGDTDGGADSARRRGGRPGGARQPRVLELVERSRASRCSRLQLGPGPIGHGVPRGPPPPIHAAVRATETNRQLAELIDEIDKLSNADVISRRRVEVLEAQAKYGVNLRRPTSWRSKRPRVHVRDYRGLAPLKPYYTMSTPDLHRKNIRVGLGGNPEHHSFKEAFAELSGRRVEQRRQSVLRVLREVVPARVQEAGARDRISRCSKRARPR